MNHYIYKLKIPIFIQILFTILYSMTAALFPLLNKYLFDNILQEGASLVIKLVVIYFFLVVLNCFFQYIARLYEWKLSKSFFIEIKKDLFDHIVSLTSDEFYKRKASDYLAIFNNNVEVIDEDYLSAYIDLFKSIINILIFSSTLLLFVDWRITLVVLISSVAIIFMPRIMHKRLSKSREAQLSSLKFYFAKVLDLLSGKKRINKFTVKAIKDEHFSALINSEKKRFIFGKTKTTSDVVNALGVFLVNINTFIIVALLLVQEEISVGVGIAAFGYTTSFLDPIRNILNCINAINSAEGTLKETLSFLDNELLEEAPIVDIKTKPNHLILKNVSYKIGDFCLDSLNYSFEKNKKYAIVGHSGSGKSTLLKLIEGSIDLSSGQISIDKTPIEDLDRADYIFSIDQFEYLFQTNFTNNITVFNSMDSETELVRDFLEQFNKTTKNKIKTYENVKQLSGGERQILGIIRMLVADRPIILMDESFSSIDANNTQIIRDYIMSLQDKIIIVVTHDIAEEHLNHYDHIIHLEEGKISSS